MMIEQNAEAGMLEWQMHFIARRNEYFERASADEILGWSLQNFNLGLTIGTAFGASGIVLIDLALKRQPDIDIFYIDTGYFFPETYTLIQQLQFRYQRAFRRIMPLQSVAQQSRSHGRHLFAQNPDLCCQLRKVSPLQTALQGRTAWATALRRDQSPTRATTPILQWQARHSLIKIAPLAKWNEEDIWTYIHQHKLPYNRLHDQNYPSIGCWPCTEAVQPGDDLRGGRWAGSTKTECGLHWPLKTESTPQEVQL